MSHEAFRESERAGWNARASIYDLTTAVATVQCIPAMLDLVRPRPGLRLLDLGCGTGCLAGAADALGSDVIGVDFAGNMVAQARTRFPGIDFQEGDILSLPFDRESFNAVLANIVLFHVTDPDKAIAEAFRVLRPGGRFVFSHWCAPDRSPLYSAIFQTLAAHADFSLAEPAPDAFALSDPAVAAAALEAAGFGGIKCSRIDNLLEIRGRDFFDFFMEFGVRVPLIVASQTPPIRQTLRTALDARMIEFAVPGGYDIPMPSLVLSGDRP